MKIASWNVNSIKARLEPVKRWLARVNPDILMLQELKGTEFPGDLFSQLGYQSQAITQKAYNGVAILSRTPIDIIQNRLDGDDLDDHARYLETDINGIRVINIYLPNGNPTPGDKFDYKLKWMDRLYERLSHLRTNEIPFLIGGDFNVIPEARDCYNPKVWENDALYRLETRQKFRRLLNLGLTDAFRVFNQNAREYTFWDYQAGAWHNDMGIRIDHFLTAPPLTDRLLSCTIDKIPRGEETPSDHTPILVEIAA